ncbi:MAG: SPFH domain-containing protein [Nocardioidaceae bacterium]|nr:SPFH domain-containing protein [Nocardioidaceae bacterium]
MPGFVIPVVVAVVVVLVLVLLLKTVWRVAEPNEALIISGLGAHGENGTSLDSLAFKIVVGRGTMVIPGFQTVRRLPLDIRSTGMEVDAVSNQSIPLKVRGVVAYKIGDDLSSIANAARRFLEQSAEEMQSTIHELFAGHLRAIVGGMTVEEMLHNREVLTANIRTSLADDLQKLGLVVDSLQIQEINDSSNYIVNLGKPQAADVEAKARIAAALRNQDATAAEQAAAANNASAVRDSRIKQEGYQAEVDTAANEAAQAGPLAEARARREVVRAETEAAELDAQRTDRTLDSTVRKPADAAAYQARVTAEGERDARIAAAQGQAQETTLGGAAEADATRLKGQAEAAAIQARGEAEAAGIKARAEALAVNSDAVVAQQMAENYPAIVTAAASSFEKVGTMVVLNGADGVEDMLGKAMTMGGAGFGLARQLMDTIGAGTRPGATPEPAATNGDGA